MADEREWTPAERMQAEYLYNLQLHRTVRLSVRPAQVNRSVAAWTDSYRPAKQPAKHVPSPKEPEPKLVDERRILEPTRVTVGGNLHVATGFQGKMRVSFRDGLPAKPTDGATPVEATGLSRAYPGSYGNGR